MLYWLRLRTWRWAFPTERKVTVLTERKGRISTVGRISKEIGRSYFALASSHRARSMKSKQRLFNNPTADFSGKSSGSLGRPSRIVFQSLYSPLAVSDRKFESREIGVRYNPTTGAPRDSKSWYL